MIHVDERWVTVSWEADIQAVLVEWKGFADSKELRSSLDAAIDLAHRKKATRRPGLSPVRAELSGRGRPRRSSR
ncbi:hypothetical protein [Sorangium sp. So ce394]|uniref:hypothetical protein n=1 Tax=Sorangium sp. So ce394 TaxID=3133310 RepID=UPI003F5C5E0D